MQKNIFIVIPADTPHGPVKGAYALANSLSMRRNVTLVTLKKGPGAEAPLNSNVRKICLADSTSNLRGKIKLYKRLLDNAGGRNHVASISMCFSADALNLKCRKHAVICSSVRSNLISNYRMDYGLPGVFLAVSHLVALRFFDHVVAMTSPMAKQIKSFSGVLPTVIGNFIDENPLVDIRQKRNVEGLLRFAFVGSLSERKQPWLIVQALADLRDRGVLAVADLIGEGQFRPRVEAEIRRLELQNNVTLHGFINTPYELMLKANVLVLPSLSEGMSRAALEALFLGVPCVLRDVDGNSELIIEERNGSLFSSDEELPDAMLRAATISQKLGKQRSKNLLPSNYHQDVAADMYLRLVES